MNEIKTTSEKLWHQNTSKHRNLMETAVIIFTCTCILVTEQFLTALLPDFFPTFFSLLWAWIMHFICDICCSKARRARLWLVTCSKHSPFSHEFPLSYFRKPELTHWVDIYCQEPLQLLGLVKPDNKKIPGVSWTTGLRTSAVKA